MVGRGSAGTRRCLCRQAYGQALAEASKSFGAGAAVRRKRTSAGGVGLIFAVAVSPLLPLPATRVGNLVKALIFGTILAVLALFVTAPYAFAPLRGIHDPLIAIHLGWKYVISVLLFHWIYGTQLGLIYSPLDEDQSAA